VHWAPPRPACSPWPAGWLARSSPRRYRPQYQKQTTRYAAVSGESKRLHSKEQKTRARARAACPRAQSPPRNFLSSLNGLSCSHNGTFPRSIVPRSISFRSPHGDSCILAVLELAASPSIYIYIYGNGASPLSDGRPSLYGGHPRGGEGADSSDH
jgi:hypothetical protein